MDLLNDKHRTGKFEEAEVNSFTTDIGMKIRKVNNRPWRALLKDFAKPEYLGEKENKRNIT